MFYDTRFWTCIQSEVHLHKCFAVRTFHNSFWCDQVAMTKNERHKNNGKSTGRKRRWWLNYQYKKFANVYLKPNSEHALDAPRIVPPGPTGAIHRATRSGVVTPAIRSPTVLFAPHDVHRFALKVKPRSTPNNRKQPIAIFI